MPPTDTELNAMLLASAPVHDVQLAADPRIRALLAELGREIPRRRSRLAVLPGGRWRPVLAAAAAALVIAIPAAIHSVGDDERPVLKPTPTPTAKATPSIPLRTGDFHRTEDGTDDSEWLNLSSPELPAKIEEWGAGVPLPPGIDWAVIQKASQEQQKWEPRTQEESFKVQLGHDARCAWMGYWRRSGPVGKQEAGKMLVESRSWPLFSASDWTAGEPFDSILAALKRGQGGPLKSFHDEFCAVLPQGGAGE